MMSHQKGFTLIELVAVIVILGALAVVALPRFVDLQDEAERAAAEGVAGALSAASATNYAAFLASDDDNFKQVDNVNDLPGILQDPTALDKYNIPGCSVDSTGTGESTTCELQKADVVGATFGNNSGTSFNPPIEFNVISVENAPPTP